MNLTRRSFFSGLSAAIAAPYVVRNSGLLMPVKDRIVAYGRIGKWPLPVFDGGTLKIYEPQMISWSEQNDFREWVTTPDGQRLLLLPEDQFWKLGLVKGFESSIIAG